MTKEKLKEKLYKLIDEEQNLHILEDYKVMMEQNLSQKSDFWDHLSEDQKASVKRGMEQSKNGETLSDEEIQAEVKSRYNLK